MIYASILTNRGYIIVSGEDRADFLQGLLTNDVTKITDNQSIYALLLTPQGKYCYDLIISQINNDSWVIEGDADRLHDLITRLNMYKLRSQVTLTPDPDHCVVALWNPHGGEDGVAEALELPARNGAAHTTSLWTAMMDPRLEALGARLRIKRDGVTHLSECLGLTLVDESEYKYHRIMQGVPESASELIVDKSIPLECGMDELNAIDWNKGCYVGQELTARTRYRGLVRKRLVPFTVMGAVNNEDRIMAGEAEVGSWYVLSHDKGLALLRLEALEGSLTCGGIEVLPNVQGWMKFGE